MIYLENSNSQINLEDLQTLILISLVCGIVTYGIFNISIYKRVGEYGILRAIGCNNFKIFKLVLQELFSLYISAVPIGLIFGIIGALVFNNMAQAIDSKIVLAGKDVNLGIVFPTEIIIGSIISIGFIMIFISFLTLKQIKKLSIIDAIKGNLKTNSIKSNFITLKFLQRYMKTYKAISFKNILREKNTFLMIILSMSICGTLFIISNYKLSLSKSRDDEYTRIYHMNSDFMIYGFNEDKGRCIDEKYVREIQDIDGIKNLELCRLIPSKMILEEKDILNQKYFDNLNYGASDTFFHSYLGKDKNTGELILKDNFRGYNDAALEKLKNYLLTGTIDISRMKKDDLAIVYIPQVNEKFNRQPLRDGKSALDIKAGDKINIKFRKNKILDDDYYKLTDKNAEYIYKEFIVDATVSYDYMGQQYKPTFGSADVIISEDRFKDITGVSDYYSINVNMNQGVNHKKLEKEIAKITSKVNRVKLKDLVQRREDIKAFHAKKKIYNLGIISILFIINISNSINNIGYNILSRTKEFGILKAIGLNNSDFKKMIMFEGFLYGVISSFIITIVSLILQKIIYKVSGLYTIGVEFKINYIDYVVVIMMNVLLGFIITYFQSRKLKDHSIIECINKVT